MIDPASRYANASVVTVNDSLRGTLQDVEIPIPSVATYSFTYYQITEADRVDTLAFTLYGDGTLWWKIANINPEIIDWTAVPVGTVIRLPSVN